MKKQIKDLRVSCDGLAQLVTQLKPTHFNRAWEGLIEESKFRLNSIEIERSADNLYLAKAWLGKMLGELGEENPYKSGKKTVQDIEPTADTHKGIKHLEEKGNWNTDFNHIEKVDWLREEIQTIIEDVSKWYTHTQAPSREFSIARTNVYNYLCEAKFQLGFELQRIKKESD